MDANATPPAEGGGGIARIVLGLVGAAAVLGFLMWYLWVRSLPRSLPRPAAAAVRLELVIARYEESLDWLGRPELEPHLARTDRIDVYNKGRTPVAVPAGVHVHALPNVGREGHTYLLHAEHHAARWRAAHAAAQAVVVVFIPGSVLPDRRKWRRLLATLRWVARSGDTAFLGVGVPGDDVVWYEGAFRIKRWRSTHAGNAAAGAGDDALQPSPERPLGVWWRRNFGDGARVPCLGFWGIFAVHVRHLARHPPERFRDLRERYLNDHSNPEAGHYFERAWPAVFGPVEDHCYRTDV